MTMDRAAMLKDEFDRSFAAPRMERQAVESFLVIRLEPDRFAFRLSDVASVHTERRVVPIPTTQPALVGLAAFRGAVAPVYSLRLLLGYPDVGEPRWLMLLRSPDAVALAFDAFHAHLRADPTQLVVGDASRAGSAAHVQGGVRVGESLLPLIDAASLLAAVAALSSRDTPPKE